MSIDQFKAEYLPYSGENVVRLHAIELPELRLHDFAACQFPIAKNLEMQESVLDKHSEIHFDVIFQIGLGQFERSPGQPLNVGFKARRNSCQNDASITLFAFVTEQS